MRPLGVERGLAFRLGGFDFGGRRGERGRRGAECCAAGNNDGHRDEYRSDHRRPLLGIFVFETICRDAPR